MHVRLAYRLIGIELQHVPAIRLIGDTHRQLPRDGRRSRESRRRDIRRTDEVGLKGLELLRAHRSKLDFGTKRLAKRRLELKIPDSKRLTDRR